MSIQVVIADDHFVVRDGVRAALEQIGDIELVGEAESGGEAVKLVGELRPDVLLLDIRFPDFSGLAVLEYLLEEELEPAVVIYTAYNNPTYIARSLSYGASYLLKGTGTEALVQAIRDAAAGCDIEANRDTKKVAGLLTKTDEYGPGGLTAREIQVIRHLAMGLNNKDIALSMKISIETVKEHVRNILKKLDVHDRTKAAVWALKNGLA